MNLNPETVRTVAQSLDDTQRRALGELDDYRGHGPSHLSSWLGIPLSEARNILRTFWQEGIVDYGPLMNEDGMLCGRGYWLERFGLAVRKEACGI